MSNRFSAFSRYHPVPLFLYFISVLVITMFSYNPVYPILSLMGAASFQICTIRHGLSKSLLHGFVAIILITAVNPLFSHNGATPLLFINGKAITLEAIIFGAVSAMIIVSVIGWCKILNRCFGSDKFLYLFGRIIPKLSLIISMSMKLIPDFSRKYKDMHDLQKAMSPQKNQNWIDGIKTACAVFSALITRALENSADTALSMKARGYGSARRTSFSVYRFHSRDGLLLSGVLLTAIVSAVTGACGAFSTQYYPEFSLCPVSTFSVLGCAAFALLCFIPTVIELKENIKWNYSI